MKNVTTVLGSISPDSLGFCQCHEHLMLAKGKSHELNADLLIDNVQKSCQDAQSYHIAGGTTIIDAQPVGCGRMAVELASISRYSKVNIIASTGFHKLCFYPADHWIYHFSLPQLTELFVTELTCGMYIDGDFSTPNTQCTSRAGIIKAAYDSVGLTSRYKTLFFSAIQAANATNSIISIHIEQNTDPLKLLSFLTEHGATSTKLIFCHMDRACNDLSVHRQLLEQGVYLEYDTIGRFKYHSDEHEIEIIKQMISAGYEKQLLFSLDTTRTRLKSYHPKGVGLDYILNTFISKMKTGGITDNQIKQISHINCRNIFAD